MTRKVALLMGLSIATAVIAVIWVTRPHKTTEPSARDIASASAYIRARHALEWTLHSQLPTAHRAVGAVTARISSTCAGALRGAPQNSVSGRGKSMLVPARDLLLVEINKELERTLFRSEGHARDEFVRQIVGLSWSDPRVTRVVRSVVSTEAGWATSPARDACGDIKRWVTTGYRRLPLGTQHVQFGVQAISEDTARELAALGLSARHPERDILQLLGRFQLRGENPIRERVAQLERETADAEARLLHEMMLRVEYAIGVTRSSRQARG
jgi:hypothetical protein